MKALKNVEWSPGKIAALPIEGVRGLRENAVRYANQDLVALCDADLQRRSPTKVKLDISKPTASKKGRYVIGFHFVCDRERGVSLNADGTLWTGTWVVDQAHAERGEKINAYVALHETKSEPSYLQGIIKGWRKVERDREYGGRAVKIETGIDFLLVPTHEPYQWVGAGAGEKGYAWGGD